MKKLILLSVFLFSNLLLIAQNADSIIVLSAEKAFLNIGRRVYLLEDKESKLTIADIQKLEYQKLFKKSETDIPNFNTTASKIWVKLTLQNQTDEKLYIEIAQAMAWYIDFYKPDAEGKLVLTTQTGMMRPIVNREVDNNFFIFELSKKPQTQTFYFSIQSEYPLTIPLTLGTAKELLEKNYPNLLFFGMFSGLVLVMFCYNLFIYFSVRDTLYLYYCGYLLTGLLLINFVSGNYGYQWNIISYLPRYLVVFFAFFPFDVFFILNILQIKREVMFFKITVGVLLFMVLFGLFNLFTGHYILITDAFQVITILYYFYVFFYSLWLYYKGNLIARFIVFGFSFYLLGTIIYIFQNFGLLPTNFFTLHSIILGTSVEVVLFSLALVDRINIIRNEKEAALSEKQKTQLAILQKSRENERLVKEQNLILEQAVAEKTKEIQQQNEELQASEEGLKQNLEELKTTQDNLATTLAENQALTSSLDNSAIVSVADLKGRIVKVNQIFCDISGYSKEELLGQDHRLINSGYHPREFWAEMWKTVSQGKTWRAEVCNRNKNGEIYWVDTVINPIYNVEGKIYQYLSIRNIITERKKAEKLAQLNTILKDRSNITELGNSHYFDMVLKGLLDLTESEYGFMGEVFYENGQPYLKTYALTNIAWNEETKKFYEEHAPQGLEFKNLDTLFGYALKYKTVVISDKPAEDPRRGGLPAGHPSLNAFMGIPIMNTQGLLIGMIGVANKKNGYTEQDAQFLNTFLDSFANIIQTFKAERKRLEAEIALQKQNERLMASEEELKQNLEELQTTQDKLIDAQKQALAKSRLLEAIAKTNTFLLEESDWQNALNKGFGVIGKATGVDRIYYFERTSPHEAEDILISQKIEWVKEGIHSEIENPELQNIPLKAYAEIADKLLRCEVYAAVVSLLPEGYLRQLFAEQGIVSLIMSPVFVDDLFFGFIGFDYCSDEHQTSEDEIAILQTLTTNLATTIQHKNAEQELLSQEQKFRHLFEGSNDAVMMLTPAGFTDCNGATLKMFNISKEEFIKTHPALLSPELQPDGRASIEAANERIEQAIEKGFARFEWVHRRCTGEDFFAEVLLSPYQKSGNIIIQATVRDITERKQAEQRLLESENKLRGILDSMQDSNVLIGADFQILSFNRIIQENIKKIYNKEVKLYEDFRQYIIAGTEEGFYQDFQKALNGEVVHLELPFTFSNVEKWYSFTFYPVYDQINRVIGVSFNSSDITERKQAENHLKLLQSLIDASTDAMQVSNEDGTFFYLNSVASERLGIKQTEVHNYKVRDIEKIFETEGAWEKHVAELKEKRSLSVEGENVNRSNGHSFPVEVSVKYVQIGDQGFVIANSRDITQRKQAEQALVESQTKLQSVLNEVQDVIWSVSMPDLKMLLVTPSIQMIYGYSVEECMEDSRFWQKAIHPEDQYLITKIFRDIETQGFFEYEYRIITKQGQIKWVLNKAKIILGEKQQAIRLDGVIIDITSRKQAEAQIHLQNQELQSSLAVIAEQRNEIKTQNEELQRYNQELKQSQDEINELNNHLESLVAQRTQKLIQSNQKLNEYAFFNAHKLRAPIATILGLYELLKLDTSLIDKEVVFEKIKESIILLDEMVKISQSLLDEVED
jgi:PAS domain S-box-containing protein